MFNALAGVVQTVMILLLGAMTATVMLQIVLRYFFERPLAGGEEITRYMFVYLIFIGAAMGVRTGIHVSIDVLVRRLPGGSGKLLAVIAQSIVGVFLIFLTLYGIQMSMNTMGQSSPALGIPIGYAYFAIPLGATLGLIFLIGPKPEKTASNEVTA
ncbi:TRAP transporter small permease [Nesterenkonia muleiensis]|uniref:TRAP transporter small permease n=1 Tax=Nesterenkonia muleiensis TaxID=2282648 RepID=UPI001300252B|nr:TRAP transporter small permease [Nesterenkonia muleiensis]